MKWRWRAFLATALLIAGAGLVADGEWWTVLGYLLLMFVPALIIDATIELQRYLRKRGEE